MSDERSSKEKGTSDYDLLDGPLPRYAVDDAVLELEGEATDLNALRNPFAAEEQAGRIGDGDSTEDEQRAKEGRVRIGRRLKALRENEGLTQKDLAERAGIPVAQVSALERGGGDIALSAIAGLVRAAGAAIADVADPDAPQASVREILRIGETAGAPREVVQRIADAVGPRTLPAALERAFGWTKHDLWAGELTTATPVYRVRFKSRKAASSADSPLLTLAQTLSTVSIEAHDGSFSGVPEDPTVLRDRLLETSDHLSLETLLRWAWDAGIIVLPMPKGGGFSAATWMVKDTPVIVLKESMAHGAYWLFDLAHELGHIGCGHIAQRGIVDVDAPTRPDIDDEQERDANTFALRLLLGDPEEVLAEVRRHTAGAGVKFKGAVERVAAKTGVSAATLGIIAAYDLRDVPRDVDRWGSANNLAADEHQDGRGIVEAEYRCRSRVGDLQPLDATLIRAVVLRSQSQVP